ncbi:MAG: T9SS type A sorting domain-containing protein [Bacteroidetes bacterium]|nr:T9SS type A sorting domain-containing protein [Bacteroidota bacterium]MBU1799697.1 T9SS type A sorting domain-containing protein [Bacteroidota bacterium]
MKNRCDSFNLFFTVKYISIFFFLLSSILQLSITSTIFAQNSKRTRLYTHPQNFDAYNKIYNGWIEAHVEGHVFYNDTYIPIPNAEINLFYEEYWVFESEETVDPCYMFLGLPFPFQGWLFSCDKQDLSTISNNEGYFVFGSGSSSHDIYLNYTGDSFTISGTVTDSNQAPIPETTINLYTGTFKVAEVFTDSDGNFQLLNILPSNYTLIPEKENYVFEPDSILIELSDNDISGISITGKPVKPFQVWILPKDPFAPQFHKTGVIPADKLFPAKVFAKMENEIGEPIKDHPIKFTLQNPELGELRFENNVEQETITVPTDENGIAVVYYHFTSQIDNAKIIEQIVIKDEESGNQTTVDVEIGLGLHIYYLERYETEAGLIVPGTQIGLVVKIKSSEMFQTKNFDLEAYLDSIQSAGIWDNPFGVDLSVEWLNKPKPSTYGKLVSLFWTTEDEVYNGYCRFDNLRDLNTNYNFNILYAYDTPKIEYGNLHSLPAIIPHSKENHLYEVSASLSTPNNQGEYVSIGNPFMQIDVDGVSSDIELFLCAFSPTTKTQFIVAEIFKNYNSWGGATLDLIDISCKIFQGEYFEALLNFAKYKGDAYLGSLKEKVGESDFLQNLSEQELAEVYKAILFKDAADFYSYISGIQGLDSIYSINRKPMKAITNLILPAPDVFDMEYQNLANINIMGMLQNEENLNSRIITVVNADEANLKNSDGVLAKEIDYDFENIDEMMKTTLDNITCFILSGDDSYTLDLKTNQNTSLSTCKAGDLEYDLILLDTDHYTSGTLEVSTSEIGSFNVDYNNDGIIDAVIESDRIDPFDSGGDETESAVVDWAIVGGSEYDHRSYGIVTDVNDNIYQTGSFKKTFSMLNQKVETNNQRFYLAKINKEHQLEWLVDGGANDGSSSPTDIVISKDGNPILAGYFEGESTFGDVTLTSNGGSDPVIVKYKSDGNVSWAMNYGGEKTEFLNGAALDYNENIIITGYFYNNSQFGTINLEANGHEDIFIAKLDQGGEVLWANSAGGEDFEEGKKVAVDSHNDIYVCGSFAKLVKFENYEINSNGISDIFLAKYSESGVLLWVKSFGGLENEEVNDIVIDKDNSTYITGKIYSTDFSFEEIEISKNDKGSFFIAKFNEDGECLWVKNSDDKRGSSGLCLFADAYSNCYVGGVYDDGFTFENITHESRFEDDIFIMKLTKDGDLIYFKEYSGLAFKQISGIAKNSKQKIFTTGYFEASLTLDGITISSENNKDIFITSMNEVITNIRDVKTNGKKVNSYYLSQNYPNPFNPSTIIQYELSEQSKIKIEVFNMLGQCVDILVDAKKSSGNYETTWKAENLPSGVYLIKLNAEGLSSNKQFTMVKKALLLK